MKRLALSLGISALGGFALTAGGAAAANDPGASAAGAAAITVRLPNPSELFVNCPTENTLTKPDGTTPISCEFRAVSGGSVYHGLFDAASVSGTWQIGDLFISPADPDRWIPCGLRGLGGRGTGQRARKLRVHGISCANARFFVGDIGALALEHNLRIPRRFTVAHYGTNTLGWITNTFACRGRVRIRQGAINPYGHETAECGSQFGDGLRYVFDQSS